MVPNSRRQAVVTVDCDVCFTAKARLHISNLLCEWSLITDDVVNHERRLPGVK